MNRRIFWGTLTALITVLPLAAQETGTSGQYSQEAQPRLFVPEARSGFKDGLRQPLNDAFYARFEYPSRIKTGHRKGYKILHYDYGQEKTEGYVWVIYSVYRFGQVTRCEVVRGLCPEIDKAVRLAVRQASRDIDPGNRYNDAEYLQRFYISADGSRQSRVQPGEAIYIRSEEPAQPQGGREGLAAYVAGHMEYPQRSLENGVSGTVEAEFIVDEEGLVEAGCVYSGTSADLDRSALRLVAGIPPMTPARQDGKPVKSWWTWPVVYRIR